MTTQPLRFLHCKLIVVSAAFVLCLCLLAAPASAANFAVTSPWVYNIASFIAGDNKNVRPLSVWNADGNAAFVSSPRGGEYIIALDSKDAVRLRISLKNKRLFLLYENIPVTEGLVRTAFYDPATLPFIAQKVMKAMSAADSSRYSYYQRRLAEFQSRIESTLDVGKHLLGKAKILDLTGAQGEWVRSAVPGAVRPPKAVWQGWLDGDSEALRAALDEAARRKWLILLDPWTPAVIRTEASPYPFRLTLSPPSMKQDYFLHLHEIFLAINSKIKQHAANNNVK